MATYAYRQNLYLNSGYIEYNVSIPIGSVVGAGDTIRVTGRARCNDFAIKSISVLFSPPNTFGIESGCYVNKSIAKNTLGTFTINVPLTQSIIDNVTHGWAASVDPLNGVRISFEVFSKADCNDSGYVITSDVVDAQNYSFLRVRTDPAITSVALSDRANATSGGQTLLQYFGGYIQGVSIPRLTAAFATDSRDPKLTATHTLTLRNSSDVIVAQISAESPAQATSVSIDLPAIGTPGTYGWTWSMVDSAGMEATDETGTLTVLAYSAPTITEYDVERYITVVGEPDPVPSPSGPNVMLTIKGNIAQVDSKNAWTMVLRWGTTGGSTTDVSIDSGSDGTTLNYEQDPTLFTTQISLADAYEFSIIITDMVQEITLTDEVMKATCYLNVEKNGIGIGMYVSGDAGDKRVEIADDYALMPYGDVVIPENKLLKVVTVSDSVSLSASSRGGAVIVTVSPGVGWTPIGIVGWHSSNTNTFLARAYYDPSTNTVRCYANYQGTSSSAVSVTITAYVLCLHTAIASQT